VSEETSREYIRVLDDYFAGPDVRPGSPRAATRPMAAHAGSWPATGSGRGDLLRGLILYRQACRLHPPLRAAGIKLRLMRNVVSKPVRILLAAVRSAFIPART
jgi:hypothetical protein